MSIADGVTFERSNLGTIPETSTYRSEGDGQQSEKSCFKVQGVVLLILFQK